MDSGVKRFIRSDAHMEENTVAMRKSADPHEKLKALLNSPEDDTDDTLPPSDAPKFGTVIHNRIFVGGFSLTTTDEDLWKFFSTFATVTAARVIYDRAGVSKCYGFVTFASPRVARLIVKQVLIALNFYARGSYQGSVAMNHDVPMAQQTVSRCIREVTNALNKPIIVTKYIRFPQTREERITIKSRFYEKYGIPGVCGCIDGTHIAITRPDANEERFYNRKSFHSLNVQMSGGVMFSPLGRLRVAQAVRKQLSQLPVLGTEAAPMGIGGGAPLCYQFLCAPPMPVASCAPCEMPPPYAVYQLPYETTPTLYAPPTQYALLPAPYTACCEPACCAPLDKQPRSIAAPPPPCHPAFIY